MNEDSSFIALLSPFLMWEFGKGVESSNVRMYYVFGVWNRWRIIAWAWFINGKEINMFIICLTVINFIWNAQREDICINVKMWKSLERAKDKEGETVWNLNGGSKKRGSSSISIE